MATKKIRVLVCDSCGTAQANDDAADVGGVVIPRVWWHFDSGGAAFQNIYVCTVCTGTQTLEEILGRFGESNG